VDARAPDLVSARAQSNAAPRVCARPPASVQRCRGGLPPMEWPARLVAMSLPTLDLLVVRANQRIAGLALERLGERRHVRRCADGAEFHRRVRIGVEI